MDCRKKRKFDTFFLKKSVDLLLKYYKIFNV